MAHWADSARLTLLRLRYRIVAIFGAYERIVNGLAYVSSRSAGGHSFEARAMIVTHEREKLIQAINYFAQNTRKLGKTKLFKLLHFLDFEHFRATGRSVTGMTYYAWPKGPVPVALEDEIGSLQPDLAAVVSLETIETKKGTMLAIKSRAEFSSDHFSRREMSLLKSLAAEYYDADAESMVEATHLENLPWHKVYVEQGRKQQEIPYDLAIRNDEVELVKQVAQDRKELLERLKVQFESYPQHQAISLVQKRKSLKV
jgi:uncharacterized phage-associated protein